MKTKQDDTWANTEIRNEKSKQNKKKTKQIKWLDKLQKTRDMQHTYNQRPQKRKLTTGQTIFKSKTKENF